MSDEEICCVCSVNLVISCEPQLLLCLHSCCKECITNAKHEDGERKAVFCRFCNENIDCMNCELDVFWVQNSLNNCDTSNDESSMVGCKNERSICVCCEVNEFAKAFCPDCEGPICRRCFESHQRMKIFGSHKVEDKNVAKEKAYSLLRSVLRCDQHDKKLTTLCETCEQIVCDLCVTEFHSEDAKHRLTPLDSEENPVHEMMKNCFAKLEERKVKVESEIELRKKRLSNIEEIEMKNIAQLSMLEDLLKRVVENAKQIVLREMKKQFSDTQKKVKAKYDELTQLKNKMKLLRRSLNLKFVPGFLKYKQLIDLQFENIMKKSDEMLKASEGEVVEDKAAFFNLITSSFIACLNDETDDFSKNLKIHLRNLLAVENISLTNHQVDDIQQMKKSLAGSPTLKQLLAQPNKSKNATLKHFRSISAQTDPASPGKQSMPLAQSFSLIQKGLMPAVTVDGKVGLISRPTIIIPRIVAASQVETIPIEGNMISSNTKITNSVPLKNQRQPINSISTTSAPVQVKVVTAVSPIRQPTSTTQIHQPAMTIVTPIKQTAISPRILSQKKIGEMQAKNCDVCQKASSVSSRKCGKCDRWFHFSCHIPKVDVNCTDVWVCVLCCNVPLRRESLKLEFNSDHKMFCSKILVTLISELNRAKLNKDVCHDTCAIDYALNLLETISSQLWNRMVNSSYSNVFHFIDEINSGFETFQKITVKCDPTITLWQKLQKRVQETVNRHLLAAKLTEAREMATPEGVKRARIEKFCRCTGRCIRCSCRDLHLKCSSSCDCSKYCNNR